MKRLLSALLIALCIIFPCFGDEGVSYNGASRGAPSGVPDYIFRWTAESTTADYVVSGDNVATAVSGALIDAVLYTEGTHSLDLPTASDRFSFDWANDTCKLDAGTLTFYVYFDSFANGATLFRCRGTTGNSSVIVRTSTTTNNHLILFHTGNTTSRNVSSSVALSNTIWYKVTAKWSVAGVTGNYLSIQINAEAPNVGTTALVAPAETTGTLDFGEANGVTIDFHLDDITIWGTWQ